MQINWKNLTIAIILGILFIIVAFLAAGCGGDGSGGGAQAPQDSSTVPTSNVSSVKTVKIYGYVNQSSGFNRVGLFANNSQTVPYKSAPVDPSNGYYEIILGVPGEMVQNGSNYSADMRFYVDGQFSSGHSQCHFLVYFPATGSLQMQIYQGPTYDITGDEFRYDYN